MQVDAAENTDPFIIGKRHIPEFHVSSHAVERTGVGCVGDIGLNFHEFPEPSETRHSHGVLLHKAGEAADGLQKGSDIQGKGDQIDVIEIPLHDEKAAEGDDGHVHDAAEEIEPRKENPHFPVVVFFGSAVTGVALFKFFDFVGFVVKGTGYPYSRNT